MAIEWVREHEGVDDNLRDCSISALEQERRKSDIQEKIIASLTALEVISEEMKGRLADLNLVCGCIMFANTPSHPGEQRVPCSDSLRITVERKINYIVDQVNVVNRQVSSLRHAFERHEHTDN